MLQIPWIKQYEDWATVYPDGDVDSIFYAIPNVPTLRWFPDGTPAFTFLKFAEAVQSGGTDPSQSSLGGGYVQFDCELSLTDKQTAQIQSDMQDLVNAKYRARNVTPPTVQIAPPTWHDSDKVGVMLITLPEKPDGSGFINHIATAGKPSLLGANAATFAAELSERGAALLWQAFQMDTMPVAVVYRLEVMAQIPDLTMHVWLHASQMHAFREQVDKDIDSSVWGDTDQQYTDTMTEIFAKYAIGGVDITGFDPALAGNTDFAQLKKDMQAQGWALMEQTLQDDMKDKFAPTKDGDKGAQGDFNHTTRDYFESFSQDLDVWMKDRDTVPWPMNPQGSMKGILTQPGPNGQIPKKEDLFKEISLDDPFFRLLQLRIHCNCDFASDPIDSVLVHVEYGSTVNDFKFTAGTLDTTFRAFIDPALGKAYSYSYQVNYKGSDKVLKSAPLAGKGDLLQINVADMGYLKMQVMAGQFNWKFIDSAQVHIKYADIANGVAEQDDVLILRESAGQQPYARMIYAPITQPYQYSIEYFFKNEQRTTFDYTPSRDTTLVLNDMFTDHIGVKILASGGFDQIDKIVVDLDYEDPDHQYGQQDTFELSALADNVSWGVPVWSGATKAFRHRSLLVYKDGHSVQNAWQNDSGDATILVGEVFAATLTVSCLTDLVDWTQTKLVKVTAHYADSANAIDVTDDFVFTAARPTAPAWSIPVKDAAKLAYDYTATFYLSDGTQRSTSTSNVTDGTIVLQVPAAIAVPAGAAQ
jgi:hypothetical protein